MACHFRIYYLTRDMAVIRKIADKFRAFVSVNYESRIVTDDEGAELIFETERRGFIKIRSYGECK